MAETWLKCSACKTEIAYGATHWVCSVSTCNRNRMRLVFCSVACWDSHLSTVRHRDAGAIEARAPSKEQWQRELAAQDAAEPARPPVARPASAPAVRSRPGSQAPLGTVEAIRDGSDETRPHMAPPPPASTIATNAPVRRVVGDASPASAAAVEGVTLSEVTDKDILIVVSKMKKYIRDRSGMNCSDAVAEMLSDHVRVLCDDAIRAAARDERKTVLDRDVPRARR